MKFNSQQKREAMLFLLSVVLLAANAGVEKRSNLWKINEAAC